MGTRLQERYVEEARDTGLLIAEYNGQGMGIGTCDELQHLIDDGVLPKGTVLRAPQPSDF